MTWTRERWQTIERLFLATCERPVDERRAFLATACAHDGELAQAVTRLLRAHEADASYGASAVGATDWLEVGLVSLGPTDPLLGSVCGAFRLVERLAEGGMGTVYRAERITADFAQDIAVKVLRLGLSSDSLRERFARERQTLARLVHPNVARLLDGGTTTEGLPFIAMEFIDGVPLDRYCDERRLPIRARLALFSTVCRAVHFAHQNLILHLDLKPGNVLVCSDGTPKLLDFGVAALLGQTMGHETSPTANEERPLTPEYASPELLRGEPVSTASDCYALGVMLFELLTGERPLAPAHSENNDARTPTETASSRRSSTFATEPDGARTDDRRRPASVAEQLERASRRASAPRSLARALRGDLDSIVQRALHPVPARRYASCRDLAEDIERHLHGLPVDARRAGIGYVARKFVRRNLVVVSALIAVVLALVAGLIATLHLADVARDERDLAAAAGKVAGEQRDAAARAQARAEHDAEHARIEAASAGLVAKFLSDTFLSAPFLAGSDHASRVIATIASQAEQVRRRYADTPHLLANLLDALGRASLACNDSELAAALIVEAKAIRAEHFGEASMEHALSLGSLGQLYHWTGRFPDALRVLREAYRLHREFAADVHSDIARAANDLAAVERAAGDRVRARELHLEALDLRRRGGDRVLVAESLNNLANSEPDPQLARGYLEEALELRREMLGPDDPLTLQTLTNLGTQALSMREPGVARERLREALAGHRKLGDRGVEGVGATSRILAYAELLLGDLAAAQAAIDEAIAVHRKLFGEAHPRVGADLEVRATLHERRSAWAEAVADWREVLEIRSASLPAEHRSIAMARCSLGNALARGDGPDEALDLLQQARAALLGPPDEDHLAVELGVAFAAERLGRLDDAEAALLAAWRITAEQPSEQNKTPTVRTALRTFYERIGRNDDAARYRDPAEAPR